MMKRFMMRPNDGRGFTLVELLVVIAIIALISAVALPVVLPALDERRVSEAARELQSALLGARDAASRANAPRGIRLLPDPILSPGIAQNGILASNRYVPIEPGPDYSEGVVYSTIATFNNASTNYVTVTYLTVNQVTSTSVIVTSTTPPSTVSIPTDPTGWAYNIRQGDKIRFNDSGAYYTIAGPMAVGPAYNVQSGIGNQNSERFINYPSTSTGAEYLFLVNGVDDDGDGWIDEEFDGIDNDGDGYIDPGFNGIDDDNKNGVDDPAEMLIGNEYETEVFVGDPPLNPANPSAYTIIRRPVISPGTREVTLPDGIVIDMTTWNAASATKVTAANPAGGTFLVQLPERSRLPVDPYTFTVDIMIAPSGQVVEVGAGAAGIDQNNSSPISNLPFYHFWLTDRKGVVAPLWGQNTNFPATPYIPALNPNYPNETYLLPMPQGTTNLTTSLSNAAPGTLTYTGPALTGERRLVTMFTRSGQIVTNSIEIFDLVDTSRPYYFAQAGTKEPQ